jgi:hypothetical protein
MSGAFSWAFSEQGLQRFRIAAQVTVRSITSELRESGLPTRAQLLAGDNPFRTRLILVRLRPRRLILPCKPVRHGESRLVIAVLDLQGDTSWWWLSDVLAGVALGGDLADEDEIVEAFEFIAADPIDSLRPVRSPTGRIVDLLTENLAGVTREERLAVKNDPTLPEWQRRQLDGILRLFGSAWVFGNASREDRKKVLKPVLDEALGPLGELLGVKTKNPEIPGPHFDMAIAGAVTARVRLAMATTIAHLEQAGGSWLHAAVDSLLIATTHEDEPQFVPCRGGSVRDGRRRGLLAMPIGVVREVLAVSGAPWKEQFGFDRPMIAYVSGLYRYALVDPACGKSVASEAALGGVYDDPTGTNAREDDHYAWAVRAHLSVAHAGLDWNGKGPLPNLDLPVWSGFLVTRSGVAHTWEQVKRLQAAFPDRRIWPGTPYMQAVVDRRRSGHVVAVTLDVHLSPGERLAAEWRDQRTGAGIELTTERDLFRGTIRGITYRELLELWRLPRDVTTTPVEKVDHVLEPGMRRTLPVRSRAVLFELVGKEGDDLRALLIDPGALRGDDLTVYRRPDTLAPLLEKAQGLDVAQLAAVGVPERTARYVRSGRRPSPETAALLAEVLRDLEVLQGARSCARAGCDRRLTGRKRYCSDRCRKAVSRAREAVQLAAKGASRCRACGAVRYGDLRETCPGCAGRGAVEVEAVSCPGCGVARLAVTEGPCPFCEEAGS